jgi:hypothetical protein
MQTLKGEGSVSYCVNRVNSLVADTNKLSDKVDAENYSIVLRGWRRRSTLSFEREVNCITIESGTDQTALTKQQAIRNHPHIFAFGAQNKRGHVNIA